MLLAFAIATPTTPFVSHAYNLPWSYLLQDGPPGSYTVVSSPTPLAGALASAQYNRSNADIGWDYLKVTFDERVMPLSNGYYSAGYLEGYLTADVILLQDLMPFPDGDLGDWVAEHMLYLETQAARLGATDKLWNKVGNLLDMMRGIADGASAATKTNITYRRVFLLNFGPEIPAVMNALPSSSSGGAATTAAAVKPRFGDHCSGFIRVTNKDLFVGQATWGDYTFMAYRLLKVYALGNDPVVQFSSHPATIASGDDWYQTSNQLAIQETTNSVPDNASLYKLLKPQTISEFLRVMSATLIANSGEEWTLYFSRENSGTYNNQYMVVDFKMFAPGSSIVANTLWVAEQMPERIVRADVSNVLASQGYWASYNIPYFKEIYNASGFQAEKDLYGDFYSYERCARARIFRRNASDVASLEQMQRIMRYNDYAHDPLSAITNCSGAPNDVCGTPRSALSSVASRGDLMATYNSTAESVAQYGPLYAALGGSCFGAVDAKIASWSQRHTLTARVISGPTNDNLPTFQWNTGACSGTAAPAQTPTVVDFPWVEFKLTPP